MALSLNDYRFRFEGQVFTAGSALLGVFLMFVAVHTGMAQIDQSDPVEKHRLLFYRAINDSDTEKMEVLLRTPYVRVDEPSRWGYWIEAVCAISAVPEGDIGPMNVLIKHNVNFFNGDAIYRCLYDKQKFMNLSFYMNQYADKSHIPRDKYLTYALIQRVVMGHDFANLHGKFTTPNEWDEDAKLRVKLLVDAGISPLMFASKTAGWLHLPESSMPVTLIEAASMYNLPKTAEYLRTEYDVGPCKHNSERNIPAKRGDHIDIRGQWAEIKNGKFVASAITVIRDDMRLAARSDHDLSMSVPGYPLTAQGDWKSANGFTVNWERYQNNKVPPLDATVDPSGCLIKWSDGKVWGR